MLRIQQNDDWMTRLAKLIPAEALALYGTVSGMIPADLPDRKTWLLGLTAITVLIVMWLRSKMTAIGFASPQRKAVWIAAISFIVWVAVLPSEASPFSITDQYQFVPGVVAFLWAFVATQIERGP